MRVRRFLFMLIMVVMAARICHAQDSTGFVLEFGGSYGFGAQIAQVPVFAGSTECGEFTAGTSRSITLGGRYIDPAFFSPRLGLFAGVGFSTHNGALVEQSRDPLLIFGGDNGAIEEVVHEYRYNIASQSIQLEAGASWAVFDALAVQAGLSAGYKVSGRLWQIDTITSGGSVFLPAESGGVGTRERPMVDGENLSLNPLAIGLVAGVSVRLPVGQDIWLAPGAFAKGDIGSLVRERPWRAITGGVSLSVLFGVRSGSDDDDIPVAPPVAPIVPVAVPPAAGNLTASVDLYGTDADEHRLPAATIRIFETFRRTRTRPLDKIVFDHNESVIPGRYAELTPASIPQFNPDSLNAAAPADLRRQALNLIGARMRRDSLASVELSGLPAWGERSGLARARVAAVRRYLSDVWGIDMARLRMGRDVQSARTKGNGAVRITASSQGLVGPAVTGRTESGFDPPLIMLDPEFKADAGVKRWEITLSHDGQQIGSYGSRDTAAGGGFRLDWAIIGEKSGLERSTLMAELIVEDSLGRTVSSRSQTPLVIERQTRIVDRWEKEEGKDEGMFFTLYPFAVGSAEVQGRNQEVVGEIASAARKGARIRVMESGESDLAMRRSRAVADALRSRLAGKGITVDISKPQDITVDAAVTPLLDVAGARGLRVLVEQNISAIGPR